MIDPYNIGVEILVLYSLALISNIVLLKSEVLTSFWRRFKAKSSTQQMTPLKMDVFFFTNTVEIRPDASSMVGDMVESRQIAKICSVILN